MDNKFYKDYRKFAMDKHHMSGLVLDDYKRFNERMAYQNPYVIEESQQNMTQLDIFSRLMKDRIIFLGDQIDDMVCNIINSQLLFLYNEDEDKDISIYINSPGGSVRSGLALIDTISYVPNDITTICLGTAASMGAMVLICGDKRYATYNSSIMIHTPSGGSEGSAESMIISAEQIKFLREKLYKIIAANTGQDYDKVFEICRDDHWMTAQEALDFGAIDHILKPKKQKARITNV